MITFADRIEERAQRTKSCLVVGIDPTWNDIPVPWRHAAWRDASTPGDALHLALTRFYSDVLTRIGSNCLAIKPNIAFFEQFGVKGLEAFADIVSLARQLTIPVICDGKRGDIGSTAAAYARAYLAPESIEGWYPGDFEVDALTVHPFLGSSSLDPLLSACHERGKGIFVLLRTSNPDSREMQGCVPSSIEEITPCTPSQAWQVVAQWVERNAATLEGACGLSGVGIVVGATIPEEAKVLRRLLPKSLFLVPGYGAQGASAADALSGATADGRGLLINASRSIFSGISTAESEAVLEVITQRVHEVNHQLSGSR